MVSKDKLIYDGTTPSDGDSVAAFLHATLKLTSTTIGGIEALDVNIASPLSINVDLNGIYDVSTNPTPDNSGLIGNSRGASPDATTQIERMTVGAAISDNVVAANVHGLDVNAFGMCFDGTTWDRLRGTNGILDVNVTSGIADSAADSGNPLKVGSRAIAGALVSTGMVDNDRADLVSDLYRRIWVNATPNVAGSNAAVSVDSTAGGVALFASPLPGRQKVRIQNLGNKEIWFGFGTVSAANGSRLAGGSTEELWLGPDLALKAFAASGTQDVRVLQLA